MAAPYATTKSPSTTDVINERLQRENTHLIDARIAAIRKGHYPGHFLQVDTNLYAAVCHCGAMTFVNISTGEISGQAAREICPRAAHHLGRLT